ncbi:MAG: hypothetical protein HY706_19485 [Candidatus Hydrogenedentes bacterium]|nr:hypothetical protein [Candidatus Hydrogenedentota bacterium]
MNTKTNRQGIALITAIIFISVATLILGVLVVRVVTQNQSVAFQAEFEDCFQGVESAYNEALAELDKGDDGNVGLGGWSIPVGQSALPSFDEESIAPEQLEGTPDIEYMAYVQDWFNDKIDNNLNGAIDPVDITEQGFYTVYSFGRNLGSNQDLRRATESVVRSYDVNVWRNAIFAGNGQGGGLINGNVSVHGSVHLLGGNLPDGTEAIAALDLSGTSLIHNNYAGIPPTLQTRVPALPTRDFNGETIGTLNANLRVKQGLVGMSGNSEIGEPDLVGNVLKETMDGTYVNDGWTGTSVTDDGDRGDPTKLFSDNGWDNKYDLGNKVPYPMLDSDYRDPLTGKTVLNPLTGSNYTHAQYFEQVLTGAPKVGDVTIKANANFYYNATRPLETDPALRLPTDDYILFNGGTDLMEINGQVQINGNLKIERGGGGDKTINYTGRGALLVNGNVELDTDLLSVNKDGTTANSFPENNFFGIMARGDMLVGSISQLYLMGGFYAQGTVRSSKQTTTMGTFVGNYFDMGTNVPEIYQVPELPNNLPMGMIGAYPILVYTRVSWREIGAA